MHRVAALVRPVQSTFELGCAVEVFGTRRDGIPLRYAFEVCTEAPGTVETTAGYDITVTRNLTALADADTVIIPGWLPVDTPLSPAERAALRAAHARGARLVTLCSGVFALARTGLLDGRAATTHPDRADRLRTLFPRITVEPHRRYIDHGDVATSAGAGACFDLCLHLVRRDQGTEYAAELAGHMGIPPPREPGSPPDDAMKDLLTWATARLGSSLSVPDLAARLTVSPRTLSRRFAEQLGTSPGAWLLARRIDAARTLLEQTDLPIEAIAARVGLGTAVNLRRRFRAQVGTTPGAYRRTARMEFS